jgi:flagellin
VGNPNNQIAGRLGSATSASLYNAQSLEVGTAGTATTAETVLTSAIQNALSLQANIGAIQQNLEFSAAQLESSITGANEGRANYQDTDVAQESTNYALAQVQVQAGVSVLAQANLMPRSLLDLLNG